MCQWQFWNGISWSANPTTSWQKACDMAQGRKCQVKIRSPLGEDNNSSGKAQKQVFRFQPNILDKLVWGSQLKGNEEKRILHQTTLFTAQIFNLGAINI